MREIKLLIQNEEDIVMLEQGLNWIRESILSKHIKLFDMLDKYKEEQQHIIWDTIDDSVKVYDHIMCLIAQLDKHLEEKKDD